MTAGSATLGLLMSVIAKLRGAGLDVWVAGGWGEEMRGMREPGAHKDIDLVLRAPNFNALDDFVREHPEVRSVEAKRFSHKRAILWDGVLVEVVQADGVQCTITSFFNGRFVFHWPDDTFDDVSTDDSLPVISSSGLAAYRGQHAAIERARTAHRAALRSTVA